MPADRAIGAHCSLQFLATARCCCCGGTRRRGADGGRTRGVTGRRAAQAYPRAFEEWTRVVSALTTTKRLKMGQDEPLLAGSAAAEHHELLLGEYDHGARPRWHPESLLWQVGCRGWESPTRTRRAVRQRRRRPPRRAACDPRERLPSPKPDPKKALHAFFFLLGGTTFIAGTAALFWPGNDALSASLYVLGSFGFLAVDVLEWLTFSGAVLRTNIWWVQGARTPRQRAVTGALRSAAAAAVCSSSPCAAAPRPVPHGPPPLPNHPAPPACP
jgi:hypothetical protein